MKKVILLILIFSSSLGLKSQQFNGAIINDTNNIKIVKIWGTHYERGFAYGYLIGAQITQAFTNYLKPQFGYSYPTARNIITAGQDLKFDSIFVLEAKAIIAGMDSAGTNSTTMDYVDLLVCNSFLDISKLMSKSTKQGCSSLISWGNATAGTDLNGKSVISRHLDWQVNPNLINNQIICIHLPSEIDEQPWLSIGFAGMFSVLSGFNQNLGVFQHVMDDFNGNSYHGKHFEPIWFSMRKAIEKKDFNADGKNNVQDLKTALMSQTQGYADGYIISAIAKSTETNDSLIAMIAEITPTTPFLTFRYKDYADSIPGDNIYTANYQIKRNNSMNFCQRYNSIVGAIGVGTNISSTVNWELMRDYSHLTSNIQFMQFAPEYDLFKISNYHSSSPAYQNTPMSFSIADLFKNNVGISEPNSPKPKISFYPNPVNDILIIQGLDKIKDSALITVIDTSGRQFFTETKNQFSFEYELNLKSYPNGVYIITVIADDFVGTYRIVKY
ncbi:MAG: T9SS type A sorting domain-containing protein [Saprospiraceae bacterium]|nr:T9SS type A sorting domain-containing protein [Saprospiraceae bacterium]